MQINLSPFSIAFCLIQCVCMFGGTSFAQDFKLLDRVVAIVNNDAILESDLRKLPLEHSKGLTDESLFFKINPDEVEKNRSVQIDYLINDHLIESSIDKSNSRVTQDAVNDEIRQIAKSNKMTVDQLYEAVKSQGLSQSDYQASMKARIERNTLKQQMVGRIQVTDEDLVGECYRKNPNLPKAFDEKTVAHIFFNPKKGSAKAAEERAQRALNSLKSGEKFEKVAEKMSEDPDFNTGGLLGTFKPGDLNPGFEQAIKNLDPGQFSEVVSLKDGLHILQLVSSRKVTHPTCEKAKEQYRSQLLEAAYKKQFVTNLENSRQQAYIRINWP